MCATSVEPPVDTENLAVGAQQGVRRREAQKPEHPDSSTKCRRARGRILLALPHFTLGSGPQFNPLALRSLELPLRLPIGDVISTEVVDDKYSGVHKLHHPY
jgi:hypothetical protein